jgi:hypothetical protein
MDALVEDIANKYLSELVSESTPGFKMLDRQASAKIIKSKTREVLKQIFGEQAQDLMKSDYEIPGKLENNKFDVVVPNGRPYYAADGISFEVDVPDRLQDALPWRISDVKSSETNLPIAIVVLPPKVEQHNYQQI